MEVNSKTVKKLNFRKIIKLKGFFVLLFLYDMSVSLKIK
ncbi:hypothetical protein SAMN04488574_1398 [Bacillus sp. 71mf]|nr:hypothetical protein SAMN04488574_1398 [Bacillus sp. 71mf]SFT17415.1 hypothetical protein SAMN04488145_11628 [Bacillus sp. 103mf]